MHYIKTKKHKILKIRIIFIIQLFIFSIFLSTIQAQESIVATGGNATEAAGSVSYSIGQIVFFTNTGTNGSIAEGVQQPYEISVVIGIDKAIDINLICTVFPNPSDDIITLKVENYDIENLSYQLFDLSGKLLKIKKITSKQTKIAISNFPSGTYLLKIIKQNHNPSNIIKTFKIIKNH